MKVNWGCCMLLLDLTVVDIFFILVRIESVVVVGCNLFITQKIWKKRLMQKTCKGQRGMYLISSTWKLLFNFNPACYARLVLIQSATLSIGTGAMLWERFTSNKWNAYLRWINDLPFSKFNFNCIFIIILLFNHFFRRVLFNVGSLIEPFGCPLKLVEYRFYVNNFLVEITSRFSLIIKT